MKPKQLLVLIALVLLAAVIKAQNVGIGTTTPVNRLSVAGKVNITDSLGIGTTTPAARLDVAGSVKITDGTQGAGKVLKSNANGLAGWDSVKIADLLTTPPLYQLCPAVTGSVTTGSNPYSVAVSGNYAYVVNNNSSTMQVINISNPALPAVLSTVTTGSNPRSVAVSGNFAYVVNYGSDTMQVFNISNPAAPALSGSISTGSNPRSVAVSGNFAYVVNYGSDTMQVFNISNPAALTLSGSVGTGSQPVSVAVSGNYAYVLNSGFGTMWRFYIGNPAAPALSGSVLCDYGAGSVAVSGNYAYVVNFNSSTMRVFNISSPATITLSGSVGTGSQPVSVAVSGNYAYVVNFNSNNMQVFNISNPAAPTLLGFVGTGTGPGSVSVSGNYAYVANNTSNTMQVIKTNLFCPVNYALTINPATGQTTTLRMQWDTSGNNISNTNTGNVGIGTTSPASKLDVVGTTKTTNLQMTTGANIGFVLKSDASGNASWVNANTLTVTETDPKVGTLTIINKIPKWGGTSLTDGLIFDNGTNIGIGTTTPINRLSVTGKVNITDSLGIGTATPTTKLDVLNSGSSSTIARFKNGGGFNQILINNAADSIDVGVDGTGGYVGTESPKDFKIRTGAVTKMFFQHLTGNVGVGTTTPPNRLSVAGKANITDSLGIGTIVPATRLHITGGSDASLSANGFLVIGDVTGPNIVMDNNEIMARNNGATSPLYLQDQGGDFQVGGQAFKPGGGLWVASSDARLKKDIHSFADGLEVLKQINPVWFRYNGKAGIKDTSAFVGIIAQEMQKIAPYMISEKPYTAANGAKENYLAYDGNALLYILVNGVKEQQAHITTQDAQIAELKKQIAELKLLITGK